MSLQIIICQKINYVESFNLKTVYFFFLSFFFKYILAFLTPASYGEVLAGRSPGDRLQLAE